jgi:ABC-type nitrate/sulfonate/bicarbonate transport system substrate-binding protein
MLWEPWVSYAERVFGWHVLVDCPRVIRPSNYAHLIYARRSLIENNPKLVRNYVEVYRKSIDYSKNNFDELLKLDYPMDYAAPEDLNKAIKREVPLWNTDPALDDAILTAAEKDLRDQGVISAQFSLRNVTAINFLA